MKDINLTMNNEDDSLNYSEISSYYKKERMEVIQLVDKTSLKILDVGCGAGTLGKILKSEVPGREIWGVELSDIVAYEAEKFLDNVACADASKWVPPVKEEYFNTIIFADVLEHLPDPFQTLKHYLKWLAPDGQIIISIPNIRYWGIILDLANGNWTYRDSGILDKTHLRFFTLNEIRKMVDRCGLEIQVLNASADDNINNLPKGEKVNLSFGNIIIQNIDAVESREFFHFQYILSAVRKRVWLNAKARRYALKNRIIDAYAIYSCLNTRYPMEYKYLLEMSKLVYDDTSCNIVLECLQAILDKYPDNIDILIQFVRVLMQVKEYKKARKYISHILKLSPENKEALEEFSRIPTSDQKS